MKNPSVQRQQGAALLMMMLALIAISSALAYQYFGNLNQKLKRQNVQAAGQVLQEAKENILIFAASIPELYASSGVGYLPTPDFDNDGRQGNNAELPNIWFNSNNNNVIGRLPMRHNDTNPFYFLHRNCSDDGIECIDEGNYSIWVAFSSRTGNGDLRLQRKSSSRALNTNSIAAMLDRNSDGRLTSLDCGDGIVCLDGQPVVGVLIMSNAPLSSQSNRKGASLDFRQYLDSRNADSDLYNFISRFPTGENCTQASIEHCFNDTVLPITLEDWINGMEKKVKAVFGTNLTTQLCTQSWINSNSTHWAVVNKWYTVTNICGSAAATLTPQ